VTNPDGGLHTLTYDASHHLTGEQLATLQNGWAYASSGALATLTWGGSGSPSVSSLTPAAGCGLSTAFVGTLAASLTDPLGHVAQWQLDGQGRVLQQLAADGGLTQYQRDGQGRVTQVTDPLNRVTTFTRDSQGYVTQTKFPDGNTQNFAYQSAFHALTTFTNERANTTTYAYDAQGHRTRMTNALGQATTYSYYSSGAQAGLLQSVTDALNHTTTYQYDSQRRPTTVTDALNHVTSFSYDSRGNPLTTTDALGRVTTTNYDVMGRETSTVDALGNTATLTYNAADLPLTSVDALGHTASLVYDSSGRGLQANGTEALSTPVQRDQLTSYDNAGQTSASRDPGGYWTNAAYDPVGRTVKTTNALGGVALTVYDLAGQVTAARDELGRWTSYQYNSRGWLTQQTDPLGNVTAFGYDAAGNRTTVTDPLSHVSTFQYDALDRQTVVTDALNHSTTAAYDAAGNVSTVTDALSHVTSYAYDAVNRRTTTTEAVGTAVQRTSTVAYDAVGNVTALTDGLGHTTSFTYDALNRRTTTTDALGHVTTATYDAVGNTTTVTDPLAKVTSLTYDALDRQIQTTDPLSHVTTAVLDAKGQQVGARDALGNTNLTGFDSLGRDGSALDARQGLVQKLFDSVGNLIALIDPDGNQTNFVYDSLNREILRTDPTGQGVTTTYDAAGRKTAVTDRDSRQILYSYDNANRLTGETWKDSGGATVNTKTYTYDAKDNLLTAADGSGTFTLTYDALDRAQTQKDLFGLTLTYTYDPADRLTGRQDSLNGVLTSVYDNANRLTSRQFGGTGQTPLRVDPAYSNRNELTSLTRYSDVAGSTLVGTTVYSYDDSSRLTSIVNKNASAATLSYYNYAYDNADRVTSENWQSGATPGAHTYTYDSTSQLTNDSTTTYTYDLNGNRTMAGYQTGTANRLSNDGTFTYTYDNEGNLTQKSKGSGLETWYYAYDNLNHLTSVRQTSNGSTNLLLVTYTYDVFGQRATEAKWKTGGSTVTTRFAYDGQQVWAELNTSNVVQIRYVFGDGLTQLWARIDVGVGLRWELTDRLGSVRDVVDATGATILDHLDYDGFGKLTETSSSNGGRYTYTADAYDRDSGLAHTPNREYAVATGRWLQQDPIVFRAGDPNLYRYVGNDATNATDPSGLVGGWGPEAFRYAQGLLATWKGLGNAKASTWVQQAEPLLAQGWTLNQIIAAIGPVPIGPPKFTGGPTLWDYTGGLAWDVTKLSLQNPSNIGTFLGAGWQGVKDGALMEMNGMTFGLVKPWRERAQELRQEYGEFVYWWNTVTGASVTGLLAWEAAPVVANGATWASQVAYSYTAAYAPWALTAAQNPLTWGFLGGSVAVADTGDIRSFGPGFIGGYVANPGGAIPNPNFSGSGGSPPPPARPSGPQAPPTQQAPGLSNRLPDAAITHFQSGFEEGAPKTPTGGRPTAIAGDSLNLSISWYGGGADLHGPFIQRFGIDPDKIPFGPLNIGPAPPPPVDPPPPWWKNLNFD
jgi:RHS repeat-associated protein